MNLELGFETIGNATLICYDKGPVIVTDPWVQGSAYFGSWGLSHEIPEAQMTAIRACPYVWFSHGHPDHLNMHSLELFKGKKILLPDHVGGRIRADLEKEGFDVHVMTDRKWVQVSDRIKVLCIADPWQDAVLLVDINGKLVVNLNDTAHNGWTRFVRRVLKRYSTSFLMALCCYGDVDMINYYDEQGKRYVPDAARRDPLGVKIAQATEGFGAKYFVPFSSMHRYQRKDSIWVNEYATKLSDFAEGFKSETSELLPAYIRFNCLTDKYEKINPAELPKIVKDPSEFGDDWSELLSREDVLAAQRYFHSVAHLWESLDFICLKVGGKENRIEFAKRNFNRGITFEAPRASLMTAIHFEIFDDMLIGNFMKTTLHGDWSAPRLWPHFGPFVTKYADNGRAKTDEEVAAYLKAYEKRSFDYAIHRFEERSKSIIRAHISPDSAPFQVGKQLYWKLRKLTG